MDKSRPPSPLPAAEPGLRRVLVMVVVILAGVFAYSQWPGENAVELLHEAALPRPVTGPPPAAAEIVTMPAPPPVLPRATEDDVTKQAPVVVAPVIPKAPAPPPVPLAAAPDLALGVVGYDEHGAIRFAGKAAPGSGVRVSIDGTPIGEAKVDESGHWALTPESPFAPGPHKLRLEQLDAAGVASVPVEAPIIRAAPGALAAPGGHVVVQPADELWAMARTAYGHGEWYLQIFNANRNQIKDPRLIYPGQVLAIPTPMPSPSSTSR